MEALLTHDEARRIAANIAKLPDGGVQAAEVCARLGGRIRHFVSRCLSPFHVA
jgi:hypothetical protein